MSRTTAYFISDAHLGMPFKGFENRERDLRFFLEGIQRDASDLYILGDLFDFWVEYRYCIRSDYFLILHTLKKLADSAVKIHYIAGNHDFALESFLPDKLGVLVYQNSVQTVIQGKRVYLHHGDGLINQDIAYRILRKVLRIKLLQSIYKLLHPSLGIGIAAFFSRQSRQHIVPGYHASLIESYKNIARKKLDEGNEIVFLAHTHCPQLYHFTKGFFCNPGEWINRCTYAKMVDGKVSLWELTAGNQARELPVNREK